MRTLKFSPHLVDKIISGKKTSTQRLFDDKDLQAGDELQLVNSETGDFFGSAIITELKVRTLGTLTDEDWVGQERFPSNEEMYAIYRKYYGEDVNPDTEVKIIRFNFQK
jgi:hypothetical protein